VAGWLVALFLAALLAVCLSIHSSVQDTGCYSFGYFLRNTLCS